VFWCNSRRNHSNWKSKTSEDFGKIKNEAPRGLRKYYKWRNFVLRSQDILYGSKLLKGRRNIDLYMHRNTLTGSLSMIHMPRGEPRRPEHDLGTPRRGCAPQALLKTGQNWFLLLLSGKARFLGPTSVETLRINTKPFIHNLSFRMKWLMKKTNTWNFQGGVSLSSLQVSLGYVLFLL
jgi:hypothetical protein